MRDYYRLSYSKDLSGWIAARPLRTFKLKQKIQHFITLRSSHFIEKRGFTLIELAIVLVVIGLLVTIGGGLLGTLTKRAKVTETREIVKTAKDAVFGYAVKNGHLPADLEAAGAKGIDAWQKPLAYYRANEFVSGDACGVNSTSMAVNECTNLNCSTYNAKSNIAFVIYSTGADAHGACTGTASPFYVRLQDMGYNGPCTYTPTNPQYNYDDAVAYASLDEIRASRGCPQPLVITSPPSLPQGEEDSFYSYSMQAMGGKPPYTWAGSTGSGLAINSAGLISGTINVNNAAPNTGELTTCSSSINVSATVNDSAGSPAQSYTGSIPVRPKPLKIITETLPSAYEGSPYSAAVSASGGRTPYSWSMSVSPSCPSGLACSGNSISGTPASGTAGTYTVTSTASDTCTTSARSFALTINPSGGGGGSCPAFTATPAPGALPVATVGIPYNQSISLSGGQAPVSNISCTPASCNGLNLSCTSSGATISGTPNAAGTCNFTATWRDSCTNPSPQTAGGTYSVNIIGNPPSCTLAANPGIVRYGQTATLTWTITNGPANGSFSPSGGTCTTFSNSMGGTCTTAVQTTEGLRQFTLTVNNAFGSNNCSTIIFVGCQNYRVWNLTGATQDFTIDAFCRNNVGNNTEITQTTNNRYLNVGETIIRHASTAGTCTSASAQTLSYDQAMNVDIGASGGDGDCQVNFTLTGAADR